MRDYADNKYANKPAQANRKLDSNVPSFKSSLPTWAWFLMGLFFGYGLSYLPLWSIFNAEDKTNIVQPSFDEKLAKELQELKSTNEAVNRALKEDLASIKKTSKEAADGAKQAAKQAKITAGQVEKSVEETKQKVDSFEQAVGDVKKLVEEKDQKNLVEKTDSTPKSNQKSKSDDLQQTKVPLKADDSKKAITDTKKDDSVNFDFYELLPQSEVKVNSAPSAEESKNLDDNSVYVLQVGSFRSNADANRHKQNLDKLNLGSSKVVESKINGDSWFRVYLGPYKTRRKASEMQNVLARSGFEAMQIKLK